jgi:hypothetical protein
MAWKVETLIRVSIFHKGDSQEEEEEKKNMQFIHLFLSFYNKKETFF